MIIYSKGVLKSDFEGISNFKDPGPKPQNTQFGMARSKISQTCKQLGSTWLYICMYRSMIIYSTGVLKSDFRGISNFKDPGPKPQNTQFGMAQPNISQTCKQLGSTWIYICIYR